LGAAARSALLAAVIGLSGCGPDVAEWQEEVQLSDGKVIVLDRKSIIGPGSPTAHRGAVISHELCYKPMGVYLKTGGVYQPEIFDIRDGVPYVALPSDHCLLCQLNAYPEFSTLFFKFANGTWQQIPYSEFPQQADTNMLQQIFDGRESSRDAKGFVGLGTKWERDGDSLPRGGTFKKWMYGERGQRCKNCRARSSTEIVGQTPKSWEPILNNGDGC
jgi:hypothetical protein